MAASTRKTFIRPDGLEKVTGQGSMQRISPCPAWSTAVSSRQNDPMRGSSESTPAAPVSCRACSPLSPSPDLPPVRYGPFVKDRTLFAQDVVRFEGETVAAVAALSRETATAACNLSTSSTSR